ncbi:hypothetical protein AB5J52_03780 [Streptomyces sp. R39]|uniref:Uncharacterized protein n=1 Tax=Streptomyces sp. R39 TaxID=3238631 RepID=A0AB39QGQ0_9ACTN
MTTIPVAVPDGLLAGAVANSVTPFALLFSAPAIVLQHCLRSDQVVISFPEAGPERVEHEGVVTALRGALAVANAALVFTQGLAFRRHSAAIARDPGLVPAVAR